MVRERGKAQGTKSHSKKVDSQEIKDFVLCLEEGNEREREYMDLYDEQVKTTPSEGVDVLSNMDVSDAHLNELKEYSQASQTFVDPDEEMAQCVPELVTTPLPVQCKNIVQPKQGKRPRFKVTPTRKEFSKDQKKSRSKKVNKPKPESVETQTDTGKGKDSETCDDAQFENKKKDKEGPWIQCSKVDCLKWRRLSNDIEPTSMPDRWVCAMNSDPSRMECSASQETCDSQLDYDVVYTPFVEGSLVWAKVPGYPWWPGMVEDDPDYNCCYETDETDVNPISYHVSFTFDKDVSRSWVSYLSIRSFTGTENPNEVNPKFTKKYSKSLFRASTQARSAINLSIKERLKKFSFRVLYKGPIGRAAVDNDHQTAYSSNSQHSLRSLYSQDSPLLVVKKKPRRKSREGKNKKVKKSSPQDKKPKSVTETTEKCNEEFKLHETLDKNTEGGDIEEFVKKKNKKKRVLLSSEDEEDEPEKGTVNIASKRMFKVTSTSSGDITVSQVYDAEFSEEETTAKKSGENVCQKEQDHIQDTTQCDIVEKHHSVAVIQMETKHEGECRKMETERKKIKKACEKIKKNRERIKKDEKKIKEKQENKRIESLKTSHDDAVNYDSNLGKEGDVDKKKRKRTLTEDGNENGVPRIKAAKDPDKKSLIDPKCTVKEKMSKLLKTSGRNETSVKIKRKKKEKEIVVNGVTASCSASKGTGDIFNEDNPVQIDEKVIPQKRMVNSDRKRDAPNQDLVILEERSKEMRTTKPTNCLSVNEETNAKNVNPPAKNVLEDSNITKKKIKKMKKASYTIPTGKNDKRKTEQEDSNLNVEAAKPENVLEKDSVGDSHTNSWKKAETFKPTHKKTKAVFGKFKAPIKSNQNIKNVEDSALVHSKSAYENTRKEKPKKEKINNEKLSKELACRKGMASDHSPEDLECYVSLETLEKDIHNLYQELSEGETSGFLEHPAGRHQLSQTNDCVTMEFLDDELTHKAEKNEASTRCLTGSPEY